LDVTKAAEAARIVREALRLEDEQHSTKAGQEGVVAATRENGGATGVVLEKPGAGTDRGRPHHLAGRAE
jgi:hypothetical protein